MDGKERGRNEGEISMAETRIAISSEENPSRNMGTETSKDSFFRNQETNFTSGQSRPNSPFKEPSTGRFTKPVSIICPPPDISIAGWSSNKPPRGPSPSESLLRKRSIRRAVFLKSKSRFGQPPVDTTAVLEAEENGLTLSEQMERSSSPFNRNYVIRESPSNRSISSIRTNSLAPKTPVAGSPCRATEEVADEEDEIFKTVELSKEKNRRIKAKVVIEWVVFICISGCLVASLNINKLQKMTSCGLELWKWCVLAMVIFCGLLVTRWFMHLIVFLIEKNFLLRKKVLYFVHGMKKSVQVFIWIGLVLLAWLLLFHEQLEQSKKAAKFLDYVTWTITSLLIGSFLWLLKTLLLKILAINFHVNRFFDRIQEALFHQYVVQTLSGPPLLEGAEIVGRSHSTCQMSYWSNKKGKATKDKKVIDIGKVHQLKQEKVSSWTMKVLVDAVTNSGLYTISNVLDESAHYGEIEQTDREIANEMEAIAAAIHIFRHVAHHDNNYIDDEDLSKFMIKEEVDLVFQLFDASEKRQIDKRALTEWVVKVYNGRKALAHALNDTKTAVKQLNKLVTAILVVVTIVIWLLLVEIATTKVLIVLSSQLVVAVFMFGNTCKTIFEGIIFVFVMHPFDVGDRCVIDGVQLLVEEMNILTTVFLKLNNEKVYYPNSVLATKPISNYYRSPDMGDCIYFSIDFATPAEKIGFFRDGVKTYIETNPQYWYPTHNVVVLEIENVNNIKMALFCSHTMNYQEYGERNKRRGELVMEMKRIFESLNIKFSLLPQEVRLTHVGSESTNVINR